MKGKFVTSLIITIALFSITCSGILDNGSTSISGDWLIPTNEIRDGGPGKDGIPSLDSPQFVSAFEATYMSGDDLVIGVIINGETRAYPNFIMEHHEIANDIMNGFSFSLTFCPLTGSAIGWNRTIEGVVTEFGVSGLLFKNNLIPYDRRTNSNWSQMRNQSVNGVLIGFDVETFQVVETSWATWLSMYPETSVLSINIGLGRSYGPPLYDDYNFNNNYIIFPITNDDPRLPRKERVHGVIIDGQVEAYQFELFPEGIGVFNDTKVGEEIVVVGSNGLGFIASFKRLTEEGGMLMFEPVQGELPAVMRSEDGTTWDVFGNGIDGPRSGERLRKLESFIAFWFAWGDFYPGLTIRTNNP